MKSELVDNPIWRVFYSDTAKKQLKKLDRKNSKLVDQIMDYLEDIKNLPSPSVRGKALTANKKGYWRYRVGDYRIICQIKNDELIILTLNIAHRSTIYK
ncbi:hypothetical protein A6A19_08880 [Actinobacillus delphinicola]|uniref:type II toxin-antitoxin system RelE family toxin n=1 Tax=Actinobacillus delphinicola TaxID=51161 RepID=UPI002441684C|nr:type II toxin-antitoxin system RelE/ParE family toxin [Actinobacillus delphinicola]MDG6898081.1 hypothetical protein [Actinobacillus delphinicola]MDG6898088.1 hypothetical protein [Actinobacillus delphinicola]